MDLYGVCKRCGLKIDENDKDERHSYPKSAITILLESGRAENIDLCWRCRLDFIRWLEGEKE